jgi:NitT/TauT family transport system ATP-binding protein
MNIQISHLSKSYGSKAVLMDLSLTLSEGCCHILMGPSGCGKTTLLRLIMGLEGADCGTITGLPGRMSAVFQEDRLCEDFSAIDNVALVVKRGFPKTEIETHLRAIGLIGDLHQPVREYSGGMKRRVAIVRAVMAQSDLLLLDEPFKGLDPDTKELAIAYFLRHTKGKTCLVVTHDAKEADRLGCSVISLPNVRML